VRICGSVCWCVAAAVEGSVKCRCSDDDVEKKLQRSLFVLRCCWDDGPAQPPGDEDCLHHVINLTPSHCTDDYNSTRIIFHSFNPLECRGNYSATSNNMKLVHWPLMGGLLHLVQRGGDWVGPQPAQSPPHLPNVTANPSLASVPMTTLLYNGPLLWVSNMPIKGLTNSEWNDWQRYYVVSVSSTNTCLIASHICAI